ncbi:Acyltransferase ChoActase/COT/CPT [Aphelenchoides avenae]|nr:Acyltransferase ChoActase/COT/CPT [Aphelenchus avenae]
MWRGLLCAYFPRPSAFMKTLHIILNNSCLVVPATMGRARVAPSIHTLRKNAAPVAEYSTKSGWVHELPKLGVPALPETIDKFIALARPIQTEQEHRETIRIATDFLRGDASQLQRHLEERARKLRNWLTPWWLNAAYLEARTPLPIVTSPGVSFPPFNFTGQEGQIECAAKIIQAVLKFHQLVDSERLVQDKAGSIPFDMSQYKYLFGTTRIPRHQKDEIRYGSSQPQWSRHIILTRRGHSFHVPVYDKQGRMLGIDELSRLIRRILPHSEQRNDEPINIISADERDTWAAVYRRLEKSSPEAIRSYENALFIMGLDDSTKPEGSFTIRDETMRQALYGGGTEQNTVNRWFDKTLQFFVNEDGNGGMTYEHTPAEGPPLARLLDYVLDQFQNDSFVTVSNSSQISEPTRLQFNLTDEDRQVIRESSERVNKTGADVEVKSYEFTGFGKNIPKAAKLSPDSVIQLAMQLAFYRLHRSHPPTYETATLRQFHEGRTDTIRLPNTESARLVEAIVAAGRPLADSDAKKLHELLAKAVNTHKNYSVSAMNGKAVDRHLLGLKMMARELGLPIP